MDTQDGRRRSSLRDGLSNFNSDLTGSTSQKYSLDDMHSMMYDPMPAIPTEQTMGHNGSQASQDSSGRRKRKAPLRQKSEELCGDDLAVLDHDEREAALRRAKNREAARKSRERKMLRMDHLTKSVKELQTENELLSKCIQEISQQAASAEAETRLMKEQIHAMRTMAASEEDRRVIDKLLENAIAMAHSQPLHPQLPPQVPKDSRVAKALLRTQANAEAGHWEGALPAHSPFTHPHAQSFTPPENVMAGDRPSSHSDDMCTGDLYHKQQHPNSQQGGEVRSMHGYGASGGSAAAAQGSGSPGPHNHEVASPRAGPPLPTGHPKRSRSVRGGGAKRVSPPSAESYGGPIMLPLQDLRYHQKAMCQLEGPSMLRREGSLDLLEATGGIPSPDSLLADDLSAQHSTFSSGGALLNTSALHDLSFDGGPMLFPGMYTHSGSLL
ncbi:probable bZIP transcription factor RISBZ3 at N-terminal half [Coccomyxa sp. Obi]|nr:probable bZIP transcription factor RISBZ3 at N-terminal half [Coccomyxa sp. Obi]